MTDRRCGWLHVEVGDPETAPEDDPEGLLCVTSEEAETAEEAADVLPLSAADDHTRQARELAKKHSVNIVETLM